MKKNKPKYFILLFFCLLFVLHHFWGYLGHYGYDDMHYAKLAFDMVNGHFDPQDHFSFRITLLGLTALSYKIFGVNDFASALPAMLVSIGTLILVFLVLKKERNEIITIGLTFFSLNLWGMFYSDKLMADTFITFFSFLFLFAIYIFKFRKQNLIYAIIAALALFLGFNTKGNVVLLFPLLTYFFIVDLLLKRDLRFWFVFIGSSLFLLAAYFIFYQFVFGSALVRFKSITQNSYLNLCSYSEQPFIITLKRISYQLLQLFVSHALITSFLFIFAKPKQLFHKNTLFFSTELGFFVLAAILLLLSSNFMSISISGYSPMCLDPRHYLFIVPVTGIAATFLIRDNFQLPNFLFLSLLLSLCAFLVTITIKADTSWLLYFPIIIVLIISLLMRKYRFNTVVFSITFFIALAINLLQMGLYAQKVGFRTQEKNFTETITTIDQPSLILTNPVQKNLAPYLNKFKENKSRIESYIEFNPEETRTNVPIYLFKNYYTRYLSGLSEQQLPFYVRITNNYKKIYENSLLDIQVFKVDTLTIEQDILDKTNNFEGGAIGWSNFQANDKIVYSGSYSSSLGKFSSTLRVKIDTLNLNNVEQLIVTTNFHAYLKEESEVSFVISSSSGFWRGTNFRKQIKAYGNWIPVNISEVIDISNFKPGDTLSFYILNNDENEVYLDDFHIDLSVLKQQKANM